MVKDSPGRPDEPRPPAGEWVDVAHAGGDLTWGVGAVSSRLGVAASTLRTWERRYGIGPSHRTHGGHRRYTERDISRVELVRRMVARGVSAQDAARVARHLDRDDLSSALRGETPSETDLATDDLLDSLLAAATAADEQRLHDLMLAMLAGTPVLEVWRDVLSPTLCRLTHEVSRGAVTAESQTLTRKAVLEHLHEVRASQDARRQTGLKAQVLLATFVDEAKALPFVAWGAALAQADIGLRVIGPDVDLREVLDLATHLSPSVVVTWGAPAESAGLVRRHLDAGQSGSFIRASGAWPDEMSIRFGLEAPEIPTDVQGAVRQVLDRVR